MNNRVGLVSFSEESEENMLGEKPYSKYLQNMIDEEARKVVNEAYNKTEQLLKDHRDKLEKVSNSNEP